MSSDISATRIYMYTCTTLLVSHSQTHFVNEVGYRNTSEHGSEIVTLQILSRGKLMYRSIFIKLYCK